eukprot:m.308887 g.308887  ORF g.308887 m.308887 type:complete len:270 (+) comp44988_c0_seq1:62-871(+)
MATEGFFRKIEKEAAKFNPKDEPFTLWVDRQKRPTVGATVLEGVGQQRKEIGDELFKKMIWTLSELIGRTDKPYLSNHVGTWQRQNKMAIKAHLSTETFLELIQKLCDDAEIENKFNSKEIREALETRQTIDYQHAKMEELYAMNGDKFDFLTEHEGKNMYRLFTTKETLYPVVLLCSDADKTTSIPLDKLPSALDVLDNFALEQWKVEGYAIAMLRKKAGNNFQLAVVFDEHDFARNTRKDVRVLKKNWGWKEPKRTYYHGKWRKTKP